MMRIYHTVRMTNHFGDDGGTTSPNLAIKSLEKVESTAHKLPPPPLIPNAMVPKVLPRERRDRIGGVADKAPRGVRVQGEHEWDEQMVRIPEGLERLLSDAPVRGGVHQHHTEKHDMTGDSTRLGEVDLNGRHRAELIFFDVEKAVHP